MSMMSKEEQCDGCCYRHNCNHDLEKCCYLVNQRCLISEKDYVPLR